MAVRGIVRYPAAVLKAPATPIEPGPDAGELAQDLVDTMRASPACVGLAAPQIGVGARAFCLDVTGHRKARSCAGLVVMINPTIVRHAGAEIGREGCMSLPDVTADVRRSTEIVVRGLAPDGTPIEITADSFEARAFQHEIDHLEGTLFLDRVASVDVFPRKRYR